jgi:hypothetical protein
MADEGVGVVVVIRGEREWRGAVVLVVGSEGERRGWLWSSGMVSESMMECHSHRLSCCGVIIGGGPGM